MPHPMKRPILSFLLVFVTLLLSGQVAAQTVQFGKNKVQYTTFEWKVLRGEHVDLYYYPEEGEVARLALRMAEEAYRELEARFVHHVDRRIPLIIYASHQDFEQTNVTPALIPEGVAGFTEFLKGRVALPFNGSYAQFRRVIWHEMVHVFEIDKIEETYRLHPRRRVIGFPLWWTEGLAEYWSGEWNSQSDLFLRDLVLSDLLLPLQDLWKLGGAFLAYKIGERFFHYLVEMYGEEPVVRLYEECWKTDSFVAAFRLAFGKSLEEIDEAWQFYLKQDYFPLVETRRPLRLGAQHLFDRGSFQFKPVHDPSRPADSPRIVYMSSQTGYTNIYQAVHRDGEWKTDVVVKGQRQAEFESFHPFRSKIDVSSEGVLAFVSKYLDRDGLFLWDLKRDRLLDRYQFPSLVGLASPAWSPDGSALVFTGLDASGYSDLYRLSQETGKLERLTNDRYDDRDPDWAPDGLTIVFTSDRTAWGRKGYTNLFLLDLETRQIRYLTAGPWHDSAPRWGPDGERVYFASDRDGLYNLYVVDGQGTGGRLTDFLSATFDPDVIAAGDGAPRLLFTGYQRNRFTIYSMPLDGVPGDTFRLAEAPALAQWSWEEELDRTESNIASSPEPYRPNFTVDIASGGFGFAPGIGSAQGAQLLISDTLGDQLVFIEAGNFANTTDDFLTNLSGRATYVNLKHRLNFGIGAFHFAGNFIEAFRFPFFERRYGGFFLASYPFSKFERVEFRTILEQSDRQEFFQGGVDRNSILAENLFSYVLDTSLWLPTGPIDGERLNLTVGMTTDLSRAKIDNFLAVADARKYWRLGDRTAYAVRFQGRFSDGEVPDRFVMGGSLSLRGVDLFDLVGSRSYLLNQEIRFPLLRGLAFGFPFGTVSLPAVQGAVFFDLGNASLEGFPDPIGTTGVSFRMSLGPPLVLRLDVARQVINDLPGDDGTKVQFFFGFDY